MNSYHLNSTTAAHDTTTVLKTHEFIPYERGIKFT
jgi:hypothetical protein